MLQICGENEEEGERKKAISKEGIIHIPSHTYTTANFLNLSFEMVVKDSSRHL